MKICIFSVPQTLLGKHNIKDTRLDQIERIVKSSKKTYVQVELVGEGVCLDADAILAANDSRADFILKDLEFIETRLGRVALEKEKAVLDKLKGILEKEEFIFKASLSDEERRAISGYGLLTNKPITLAETKDFDGLDSLLARSLEESGFISFFTAGEREARAWLINKGAFALEAAGAIHSDIQRGFIRAEIISFDDFVKSGGEAQAKQAGKMRLEQKDYVMQDGDVANFRFNK